MDSTVNGNNWTQMTMDSNVTDKLFHAMEKYNGNMQWGSAMVAMVIGAIAPANAAIVIPLFLGVMLSCAQILTFGILGI